uniref:ATP synthase subunit a n=1 Tax=Pseudopotamorites peniculus TaxID=2904919 RepID=A0A9E8LPB1_9NEOP|nr:ATP synthase F0 subunit 6 [Pseudopotamorites peniculus]UZZ44303.1 ATP synthase F0 subunit 6 [Pseudopotamorites peniculus]
MANLFMTFDPSTKIMNLSLNWLSTLLAIAIIPTYFWMIPSRQMMLVNSMFKTLHKEFKTLMGLNYYNGSTYIFVMIFMFIFINNFLGLYPYIFTATSHMAMNLSLALPLWISFMIFGWFNHTQHMFTHLVPQGTPFALMSFMVLIETISNIIRPGTLAVRLMANMIAGHLLITLLSNLYSSSGSFLIPMISSIMFLLLTLEASVTLIQAYVFSILSVLYSNEVI